MSAWLSLSCFAQHSLGAAELLTMEFISVALGSTFGFSREISSSGPARCEVASCMKGFETQLDFDTAFAMVPVFVFTLVPQKAEFFFSGGKTRRVSLAGSEKCWQNSVFCTSLSFGLGPHPEKHKNL